MSGGVEWALHCCVVLTSVEEPVPATRLAELHDVSASYLAKQLQALSRAGLVRSVQGKAGGYVLTREPASITVLDVVEAVDGPDQAFTCTEIRQRGPLATPAESCAVPCAIARAMTGADAAWRAALRAVSIADLVQNVRSDSGPGAMAGISAWLSAPDA
ncbi:Rrf2 family transcriptional regulator [Streptomyces avermitilis]|nr:MULTISPECIES: Rrf2 family transcriptional regulator [Streptomyces]KUN55444.1 Rrf2 family transcriptional regulator [Streptomyces avermitilis]MYS96991.1 Rrf2 family transcriptional regulator [Streptomyces sp. SID5469]OOV26791.1 transcriptional regulator [Streptomyces avermitilis]BBJ49013.1 Rrf2 family transcriptional regulator [Streptomyces avermitilis]GDY61059.1 Rrf2 family transcriptional regulator [Streptomyces avermitilis]